MENVSIEINNNLEGEHNVSQMSLDELRVQFEIFSKKEGVLYDELGEISEKRGEIKKNPAWKEFQNLEKMKDFAKDNNAYNKIIGDIELSLTKHPEIRKILELDEQYESKYKEINANRQKLTPINKEIYKKEAIVLKEDFLQQTFNPFYSRLEKSIQDDYEKLDLFHNKVKNLTDEAGMKSDMAIGTLSRSEQMEVDRLESQIADKERIIEKLKEVKGDVESLTGEEPQAKGSIISLSSSFNRIQEMAKGWGLLV